MNPSVSGMPCLHRTFLAAAVAVLLFCLPGSQAAGESPMIPGKGEVRVIPLPKPVTKGKMSVEETMARRSSVRAFRERPLTREEISQLLWAALGQTRDWGGKTIPSAGALYPLEVYIATPDGLFRYLPALHQLAVVSPVNPIMGLSAAALRQDCVARAPAVIAITAVFERTTRRYGARGERYVHMEAGHAAQNVHLEAVALGLGSVAVGAFNDADVHRVLGLGKDEKPLYLIPVGEPAPKP